MQRITKLFRAKALLFLPIVFGFLLLANPGKAFALDSQLSGQVTGGTPSAAVVGATVDVLDTNTASVVATATTGSTGDYVVTAIPPNTYNVRVTPPAGSDFLVSNLPNVDLNSSQVVNVTLAPSNPTPTYYTHTYQGKLSLDGAPLAGDAQHGGNRYFGANIALLDTNHNTVDSIAVDDNGNFSFTRSTTDPTPAEYQYYVQVNCNFVNMYCTDGGGGYSSKLPSTFTATTNQLVTFTTTTTPAFDIPVTHLTFNTVDPNGNPIANTGAYIPHQPVTGSFTVASGVTMDWSGGDSVYGFFSGGYPGYVLPGGPYDIQVYGDGYYPVTVHLTATGSQMTQTVVLTDPVPVAYNHVYHGSLSINGAPLSGDAQHGGNRYFGANVRLLDANHNVVDSIAVDDNGNFSFNRTTSDPDPATYQYYVQIVCDFNQYCTDGNTSYSNKLPSPFTATTNQLVTFNETDTAAFAIPVTHLTFNTVDPNGNPIANTGAYIPSQATSGTVEVAPGITMDWSGGTSVYGYYSGGYPGYVIEGGTYDIQVYGDGYFPVTVHLTATGGQMTQTVTLTDPIPVTYNHVYHGQLQIDGQPLGGDAQHGGNRYFGTNVKLLNASGNVVQDIAVDDNGNFSFTINNENPNPETYQYYVQLNCNFIGMYCTSNGGGYSSQLPSTFTAQTDQLITFTETNTPVFNIPVTRLTFNVIDPNGVPLSTPGIYIPNQITTGTFDLGGGTTMHWTGGGSIYGYFSGGYPGYVLPGATYSIQIYPENYTPVTVSLTATGSQMVQYVFLQPPAPADTTAPQISYNLSSQPNAAGWNNSPVTLTWSVTDPESAITSQTGCDTVTISTDTSGVTYTCSATSTGGTASHSVTVKYDSTAPATTAPTWSQNPKAIGQTSLLTVGVSDNLSGVVGGEYFLGDTDPGAGNGTAMALGSGSLTTTFGTTLQPGVYRVNVRAKDNAGNWSAVVTDFLVVYDPNGASITGKRTFVPLLANGDNLPGLISNNQTDKATFAFNVKYNNQGVVAAGSDLRLDYSTGTHCNNPNQAVNCHSFKLDATNISWLVVDGTNQSEGIFQGTATLTIDGVTTTVTFRVTALDGDRFNPTTTDHFAIKIYAQNADPNTAAPLYQMSDDVGQGDIKIKP
ncbi:MAG TPA: carboxypeptidase-like regulatory domain-containing protein [Patescibacteria group bacterium]|nr:carboxypeptidase-like regulatory domain-containing protein [Patescibacteria group bacterium]